MRPNFSLNRPKAAAQSIWELRLNLLNKAVLGSATKNVSLISRSYVPCIKMKVNNTAMHTTICIVRKLCCDDLPACDRPPENNT